MTDSASQRRVLALGGQGAKKGFMQKTTISRRGLAPMALAGMWLMAQLVTAQDKHWGPEPGPSIVVTAGMVPATEVAQPGQNYGLRDAGFRVTAPLLGGWDWESGETSKFKLVGFAGFKTDSALVPFAPIQPRLNHAGIALG